jgi:hypothetical protein
MVVLQRYTDPLRLPPGSFSETFPTTSDGTHEYDVGNVKVEEDIFVTEESFIAKHKKEDMGIKQEEKIPEDIAIPDKKAKPKNVSYVCVGVYISLIRHVNQCPPLSMSVFLAI